MPYFDFIHLTTKFRFIALFNGNSKPKESWLEQGWKRENEQNITTNWGRNPPCQMVKMSKINFSYFSKNKSKNEINYKKYSDTYNDLQSMIVPVEKIGWRYLILEKSKTGNFESWIEITGFWFF